MCSSQAVAFSLIPPSAPPQLRFQVSTPPLRPPLHRSRHAGIDYLLITHEHWDHLDYDTLTAMRPKVHQAVSGLGIDAYFKLWGYPEDSIHALDWNESVTFDNLTIHALPARHYSRRLFASNQTLWVGFALVSDSKKLFFSGDSDYGPHFADIGKYNLSNHTWKDPFIKITQASQNRAYSLMTPLIGAPVDLDDDNQTFPQWWEEIE